MAISTVSPVICIQFIKM